MFPLPTFMPSAVIPEIAKSLRCDAVDNSYLHRTPGSAGNLKKWTWSGWVKATTLGTAKTLFSVFDYAGGGSTNKQHALTLRADHLLEFYHYSNTGYTGRKITTQVFRDPTAWYHIVAVWDTDNATAADRMKLYVNGTRITSFGTSSDPSSGTNGEVNRSFLHTIGSFYDPDYGLYNLHDGNLARICFVDGQALDASSFGYTDSKGQWRTKPLSTLKTLVESGGVTSFLEEFNNGTSTTTLGYDYSSKGNNWTLNNFTRSVGATDDWFEDTPTNNFCTLNPLDHLNTNAPTNGGLKIVTGVSTSYGATSTFRIPTTGKWFWEFTYTAGAYCFSGIVKPLASTNSVVYYINGQKYINGTGSAYGATYTLNDIIGVLADADAGTLTFYKNGVSQGAITVDFSSGDWAALAADGSSGDSTTQIFNFGQRAFAYSIPSGAKKLCTKDLPAVAIPKPKKHFDVVTHSGNSTNPRTFTGVSFQPDFIWVKRRSTASAHLLLDVIRGFGLSKDISSDQTTAEGSATVNTAAYGSVTAVTSDGFTVNAGSTNADYVNTTGQTYVDWLWKAGGTPVSNTDGSITSQVSANQLAGFSIVTYTGTGANGATVGHGLGKVPNFLVIKSRNNGSPGWEWLTFTAALGNMNAYLLLNKTDAYTTAGGLFSMTTSTIGFPTSYTTTNGSGSNFVAYCFAEIPGYSKFGSYVGNGSADGPFVYCGFRPRYALIKRIDSTSDWTIFDSARNTYNGMDLELYADLSLAETAAGGIGMDFTANGFKLRRTGNAVNNSGGTYIFAAFAEAPFKYANAR